MFRMAKLGYNEGATGQKTSKGNTHQVVKTLPAEQDEGSSGPVSKVADLSALCMAEKEPWRQVCKTEPLQVPGVQAQSNTALFQGFPSSNAFDSLLLGVTAQCTESPLSPTGK